MGGIRGFPRPLSSILPPLPSIPPLRVLVLIPAYNEAPSIGRVLADLPPGVAEVVVVDNASTDGTAAAARAGGATVLHEPRRGYGRACLRGLAYAEALPPERRPDAVAFLDGDYSDYPEELPALLAPLERGEADLVLGSRLLGERAGRVERGALLPQARYGNRLACTLMRLRWGAKFTDLGPFRAVRFEALQGLGMTDETFGWTIEMQIKAVRAGLRCAEVPVSYRRRVGVSKITGTVGGTLRASAKILWTFARHAARPAAAPVSEALPKPASAAAVDGAILPPPPPPANPAA